MHMTKEQLIEWLRAYIAALLNIRENRIENHIPFDRYGLDSLAMAGLVGDLSETIGLELDTDEAYNHSTIERLACRVAELQGRVEQISS